MKRSIACLFFVLFSVTSHAGTPCVQIYFDRVSADDWMGRTYSIFLQNLLGHFPGYLQIVSPIQKYQAGDIEKCAATFYIGSNFFSQIPDAFLNDYVATKRNVVWMGYGVWRLGDSLNQIFGYKYDHLTQLDSVHTDAKGHPTFFRDVLFKGEVFHKYGDWSATDPHQFLAPFEQLYLSPTDASRSQTIAEVQNNFTQEKIPYILQAGNHFLVADIPFSYMYEGDRYLVFADLLFDVLHEAPRHAKHYAFLRVEDVHAMTPLGYDYEIVNVLRKNNVPVNISLIPIFSDPLFRLVTDAKDQFVPMNRKPEFMAFINEQKSLKTTFVWHGVTHQYRSQKNPYDAVSASDFEFWDTTTNGAIAEDSADYVLNRLNDGWYTLQQSGVTPQLWLTPHYQASALDYLIFANAFAWNIGRVIYFNHSVKGMKSTAPEASLWFASNDPNGDRQRRALFDGVSVALENPRANGQFFPYEIFGDVYGQRLIPENLGNSQPYVSEYVNHTRTATDIVADAKRNLVLRDTWASLFYHPFLLAPFAEDGSGAFPGDPAELDYIVKNLKAMGYEFIDINHFVKTETLPKRPEPIYKELEP